MKESPSICSRDRKDESFNLLVGCHRALAKKLSYTTAAGQSFTSGEAANAWVADLLAEEARTPIRDLLQVNGVMPWRHILQPKNRKDLEARVGVVLDRMARREGKVGSPLWKGSNLCTPSQASKKRKPPSEALTAEKKQKAGERFDTAMMDAITACG